MPQKVIRFTGINRKVNEFQDSGACEELVNLRPEIGGGHRIVRPKHKERTEVPYKFVYEHTFGGVYNQIGVTSNGSIDWINYNGHASKTITDDFTNGDIMLSSAGNVLLVYSELDNKQLVFKFEDNTYNPFDVSIKPIKSASIRYSYNTTSPASNSASSADSSAGSLNEAMIKAASGFNEKYPSGLCGAAIVGCSFELEDGSEVWSTAFIVANSTRCNGYVKPSISENTVTVTGATKVSLDITFYERNTDVIKKINIYSSRPVFPYEVEHTNGKSHKVVDVSLDDNNLGGQLMYYQGSVASGLESATFVLDFSKGLSGERVMEVTAGCIERTGSFVSYNNRFHYYKSEVQHIIQTPTVSDIEDARTESKYWVPYVEFNGEWKLVERVFKFSSSSPNDFIYPMAGIKKMAFVEAERNSSGMTTVPYDNMFYVELKDSSSYNYSYAFDVTPSVVLADNFYEKVRQSGQLWGDGFDTKVFLRKESNVINVSAPHNPYVFPVKYSYGFGGEILDIATAYLPISSTQVGQFPLTVFTSNGIFSLEQGNGNTLYSNVVPLQPHVVTGKATPTPWGTFFVSSRNLYLLSGREVANLSYVLNGERELAIRELSAYKNLCFGGGGLYSFESLVSSIDFEDYIQDVSMAYDQLNNELIVSSRDENIHYSYVLNLDTKSFYKVAKKYLDVQNGARYAVETVGSSRSIVDLHLEDKADQSILLQSKPLSLDVFYTHIHRLIMSVDTKLEGNQNLCVSVFGSDNLNDWKCIISAQKQKTVLRHIRTNRAAKSYRDYIIIISGVVGSDTDLSDIIVDYTVVNRRLG